MRFKIAFRNIVRNSGRSGLSMLMIAGAVACIIVFRGFSAELLFKLQKALTDSQYGHIQISTTAFWESSIDDKKAHYIKHHKQLRDALKNYPEITSATASLSGFGLISSGDRTVSAKMIGIEADPQSPPQSAMILPMAQRLTADSKFEVIIGAGLARQLKVKENDTITAMAHTLDGVLNAVDLKVKGIFNTGLSEIDNSVFFVPLAAAQTLLDTKYIDQLTLRVTDMNAAAAVRDHIQRDVASVEAAGEGKTWYEQAQLYRRTEVFHTIQNRLIISILISLVLLGILNTVGMSIYERTGEIGTIRALGDSETSIISHFLLEGIMLGICGTIIGAGLGSVFIELINAANIAIEMPGASVPVPIEVSYKISAFVEAAAIAVIAATAASLIPSVRASRIPIVQALKRNV